MLRRERPFPYLIQDRDRHGNERRYVRMFGRIARIREKYGTPEFAIAYAEARRALESRPQEKPIKTGAPTNRFGWLAAKYFASAEFLAFDDVHKRERRSIIEACLQEPLKPGSDKAMSHVHVTLLDAAHFRMLRDRKVKAKFPGAANARLKYLSSMLSWAVERNLIRANSFVTSSASSMRLRAFVRGRLMTCGYSRRRILPAVSPVLLLHCFCTWGSAAVTS
jgi:hypothetical protein